MGVHAEEGGKSGGSSIYSNSYMLELQIETLKKSMFPCQNAQLLSSFAVRKFLSGYGHIDRESHIS